MGHHNVRPEKIRLQAAIGEEIRRRRVAAGITIRDFAAAIDVSSGTLGKIESGEQTCTVFALARAAHVFDCTLDDLVPVITEDAAQ